MPALNGLTHNLVNLIFPVGKSQVSEIVETHLDWTLIELEGWRVWKITVLLAVGGKN